MLKTFLKWLGPWLLKQLIPVLDPEAAKRAEELQAKFDAIELRERELENLQRQADERYAAAERHRQDLDNKIAAANLQIEKDEAALRESETRRKAIAAHRRDIEDAIEKDKAAIDARSDDDAFSGRLPGSNT